MRNTLYIELGRYSYKNNRYRYRYSKVNESLHFLLLFHRVIVYIDNNINSTLDLHIVVTLVTIIAMGLNITLSFFKTHLYTFCIYVLYVYKAELIKFHIFFIKSMSVDSKNTKNGQNQTFRLKAIKYIKNFIIIYFNSVFQYHDYIQFCIHYSSFARECFPI